MAQVANEPFDVVVIGGGITGAGIARDAAMRGLRTLLLEKSDLASGTSSASSKLVHGGLRYLEQGELALVHESVSERHRLRQLAPHLVRPLPFVFPVYDRLPRPLWQIRLGLWIYDAMALFRSYKLHKAYNSVKTKELEPALQADGLDGSVLYYDCMTDDARLTLETARGAHLAGAWVLTYAEVESFKLDRRRVSGVVVRDLPTGQTYEVAARTVVNATGPWTDRTLGLRGNKPRLLRPTKGVHLVFHRDRLPVRSTVCLVNNEDHRVIFAIPWGNRVVLGTTDTDFEGDFDKVWCSAGDVRYLLGVANRYFPDSNLQADDVLGTWAGLRPLVCPEEDGLGASQVSREHTVQVDDDGLITVAGGKLTTYRLMADEVVGEVARQLKQEGFHVGGCPTGSVLLPGGDGIRWKGEELITIGPDGRAAELELEERLGVDVAEHLQESYGGRWQDVVARITEDNQLGERIIEDLPYLWAEVDHCVESEMVITLRDFMRRRSQLEIRDAVGSWEVAPAIAERMGSLLNWSPSELQEQVEAYLAASRLTMAWRESF